MYKDLNYIIDYIFLFSKLLQKNNSNVTKNTLLIEKILTILRLLQNYILIQKCSEYIFCIKIINNIF